MIALSRIRRAAVAAVAAVATNALLVACGDADGTGATTVEGSATTRPADAPPADLTVAELQERTTAAQREAGTVTVQLEVPESDAADAGISGAHAVMDLSGAVPQMAMTATSTDGDVEIRTVDGTIYLLLPEDAGLPTEGKWLSIDPTAKDEASQQLGGIAEQLQQSTTPELVTEELVAADVVGLTAGDVEDVDGVATRRYDISVDVAEAADAVSDPTLAAGFQAAATAGLDQIKQSIWLDGGYLPHRAEGQLPTGTDGSTATMVATYSGWGEPVTIEAPPADQTASVADLIAAQAG